MANAAAYVRVSSTGQDLGLQRDAIEKARTARGEPTVVWYEDKVSGASSPRQRPGLEALRSDVRRGLFAKLYVWKLDRLTRSGIRDTLDLLEELDRNGCRVVSICDGFEMAGPARDVVIAVLAWAAQIERLAIRERLDEARSQRVAAGKGWGRPPRLTRELVKAARAQHELGRSVRQIAMALKVPKSTIMRAIKPSQKWPSMKRTKGLRKAARRSR